MTKHVAGALAIAAVLSAELLGAQQPSPNPPLRPPRDGAAGTKAAGTARLAGRVVAADTGRPLKRARVLVRRTSFNVQFPQGISSWTTITGANGRFIVPDLPAGTYSVTATKTGYVTMAAGQRRPLRPGVPIEVGEGQAIANLDLRLPRGGVITGRIRDDDGEPLARVTVRIMRFVYQPDGRQLVPVHSDQTDDRGEYRMFGVPPGQYVVAVIPGASERSGRIGPGGFAALELEDLMNYAPTYYPGVSSRAEAARVAVGAGQEHAGIDFALVLAPTARVRGVIAGAGGIAVSDATVTLISEETGAGDGAATYRASVAADSTFTIAAVPAGRYLAVAMAGAPSSRFFAMQSVTVSGEDLDGLVLTLAPGAVISGVVRFEGETRAMAAEMSNVGIRLIPVDPSPFGGSAGVGTMQKIWDGTFRASGVQPGRQVLRIGAPKGWAVKSITLDGRDISEEILDLTPGQTIEGVEAVLSRRGGRITGIVKSDNDVTGATVIAFPADSARWVPHSWRIRVAQVDREGHYTIEGLPAGEYLIAAVEDVEPGEWLDPAFLDAIAAGATRLDIAEGTRATKDLRLMPVP